MNHPVASNNWQQVASSNVQVQVARNNKQHASSKIDPKNMLQRSQYNENHENNNNKDYNNNNNDNNNNKKDENNNDVINNNDNNNNYNDDDNNNMLQMSQ